VGELLLILAVGSSSAMTRAPAGGTNISGTDEGLAVEPVEAPRERPHELEVLALVLAYGDEVRVVQKTSAACKTG
jgi:hypothetical protein